jgi:hypothetical protein
MPIAAGLAVWNYYRAAGFFTFHDDTFQSLADDLVLGGVTKPYSVIFERIEHRAFS